MQNGLFFEHENGILVYILNVEDHILVYFSSMKRLIDCHLQSWKEDTRRKPLLLRGARQVGKTFAVRQLGKSFDSVVEVNFELLPSAKDIFEQDLVPERLIWELGLLTNKTIVAGKTLLFLDEVQMAPQVILALRYFYELMPELHVIAAGSLLDFAIEKVGMPVGRVSTLYVYPLSSIEFLSATGHSQLINAVLSRQVLSRVIHELLLDLVKHYIVIGGMPEAVACWIATKDPKACREILQELIESYRQDFSKYAKKHELPYLDVLFHQIPHFIGQQFKYSAVHGEYKKRELAPCLSLLNRANIVYQITHSAGNGIPLGSEVNLERFKMILLDVGVSLALLGLDSSQWFLNPDRDLINRGAIVEAFIGQEFLCYSSPRSKTDLYFWKREAPGALAEVDYLIDHQAKVLPVEVKSGHGTTLRSMHQFLADHPQTPSGVRFWAEQPSCMEKLDSLPLYAAVIIAHSDKVQALKRLC